MSFCTQLNPVNIIKTLSAIDIESDIERAALPRTDLRPAISLSLAALSLFLAYYATQPSVFYYFLTQVFAIADLDPWQTHLELSRTMYYPLLMEYMWWTLCLIIAYMLIPILVIKFVYKESLRDYGLAIGKTKEYSKWFALLCIIMFCIVALLSLRKDFRIYYPYYNLISRSWADLLAWELIYFTQFVALEFFFRGFLLKSCKTSFGSNAIFIMCLPYVMLHLSKPWLEPFVSFLMGFFLGMLAIRSRSIWGGVIVHYVLALGMDVLTLLSKNGLPVRW